jgi:hypothetical protein
MHIMYFGQIRSMLQKIFKCIFPSSQQKQGNEEEKSDQSINPQVEGPPKKGDPLTFQPYLFPSQT